MTSKEIFQRYFKKKLIIGVGSGILATLIRLLGKHETSFVFGVIFFLFLIVVALIIGYIDYNFYEKSAPKIIAKLLDKEPLANFQRVGFVKEDDNKLEGKMNNYKVILSPLTNLQNDNVLIVLIPLQLGEGLDNYIKQYNDVFKFRFSNEMIIAEAILKDYEKHYNYSKLFNLIDKTTLSLKENEIDPLLIGDD